MMNSAMGDRGETPPPGVWPWYNMYQHAYQAGYPPYGQQGYYPYYSHGHPGMPFHGQQPHHSLMGMPPTEMKGFVSGGQLLPFNEQNGIVNEQSLDQRNKKEEQTNKKDDKKGERGNVNEGMANENNGSEDMPPLPPGPPPPMMRFPTPSPPGTPPNRFYQPNSMGPVKFSFGAKPIRPGGFGGSNANNIMGENNGNNLNSNNINNSNANNNSMFMGGCGVGGGGGGGKKKRKRNKGNQNKMVNRMMLNSKDMPAPPPLPPHILLKVPPPPLPPGPPPVDQPPLPPSPDNSSAVIGGTNRTGECNNDMVVENDNINRNNVNEREISNMFKNYNNFPSPHNSNNSMRPNSMLSLEECPQSLKHYMERCYRKCVTTMDRNRVDIILKGKIMRASSENTLWTKDWDNEPLPLLANELETVTLKTSSPQPSQHEISPPRKQGKGLSAAMESRLGGRRSGSGFSHKNRSPVRNKSSPKRRRDRSESSSSSDENYKPLKSSKSGKMGKFNKTRNSSNSSSKNKGKQNKQIKSHFYSETGFIEDTNPEILEKRAARFNSSSHNKSNMDSSNCSSANSSFLDYQSPLVSMRRKKSLKLNFDCCNNSFQDASGDFDLADCHIIGVCQDIEKPYLRLTAAPDASAVRPPDVLQLSLARVKERWIQNQDYFYACEQLKSIRQDLTVQGIRDSLTIKVYETHARIALEKGDHAEFNQCQSQLRSLYLDVKSQNSNKLEFTAYRVLYHIFTKDFMDLQTILASLSEEDKKDECVEHALKVRSAWWLSNYHRLFKLYKSAPRMSSYLMDWFLPRERKLALKAIVKSYRPNLAVEFVSQELAFDKEDDCVEFLGQSGVVYADPERTKIDCKASVSSVNAA